MLNSEWQPISPMPINVFPPNFTHYQLGEPIAKYPYYDVNNNLWSYILRFLSSDGKKEIRPYSYGINKGKEGWHFKINLGFRPLYNLPAIIANPDKIILIAEGEKDTNAANKLLPEYVATTTMFGAQSPNLTDFSLLKERIVIIFPDNDEAGELYSQKVATLLLDAKVKEVRIVKLSKEFPKKWGLADLLPENLTINDIKNLINSAPIIKNNIAPIIEKQSLENGWPYRLKDGWILYGEKNQDDKEVWKKVCSELRIDALTRDNESENWGRLLLIKDINNKIHRWAMPMEMLSTEGSLYRGELLRLGLLIDSNQKSKPLLQDYIATAKPDQQLLCVHRIGWHQDEKTRTPVFVLPDIAFGSNEILLQGTNIDRKTFSTKGNLLEWQQTIAAFAIGNPFICLSLSIAFAPPLLEMLGCESGGIHLYGNSSTGKTTAIQIAGSVWGGGGLSGYLKQWRMTCNGLEGVASNHCDSLLCLDELSQISSKDAAEASYMLANGMGKLRANKTGGLRESNQWRLLFLSNGEIPLSEKIKEDQFQKTHAGQEVRFIDISIDTGNGMGIFENIHGYESSEVFSRHFKESINNYYGTAIREFLKLLINSRNDPKLITFLKEQINNFIQANCPKNSDGQVKRVCNRFALIAAAGELASHYGILPWAKGTAFESASICFKRWLSGRDGIDSSETINAIKQVQHFFEMHGSSRFSDIIIQNGIKKYVDDSKTFNRVGFRFKNQNEETEFYVFSNIFKNDICKGLNSKIVSKILLEKEYIYPSNEVGRFEIKKSIPGISKNTRFYHFKSKILSGDYD